MPLCYERGQWRVLSRTEMEDLDIDPDEGKERDETPPCANCGNLPCRCGDMEEDD